MRKKRPASRDGSATLIVNPGLVEVDFHVTVAELGISMTIATFLLMKIKEKTDVWDEFQALLRRYRHWRAIRAARPRS